MNNYSEDVRMQYILNTSYKDKFNKHQVRLYVYDVKTKQRKMYNTVFRLTEREFTEVWSDVTLGKIPKKNKILNSKMRAVLSKAEDVVSNLNKFNHNDFSRLMFQKTSKDKNVNFYFQKKIDMYNNPKSKSTSLGYHNAIECFKRFAAKKQLSFHEIDVLWLKKFESFCIYDEHKSITTVSMYARTLRAIFNDAIRDNNIPTELYPFGKFKYSIPTYYKTKKVLYGDKLKILYNATPKTEFRERAKDFWFFSYACNGINFKDILHLKCKSYDGKVIRFRRSKDSYGRQNVKDINVFSDEHIKYVFEKYGNIHGNDDDFIFPYLGSSKASEEHYRKTKNFISSINNQFKKYARDNGIDDLISSNWARHSYVTHAINKGATMEYVGDSVGHTDLKTTNLYYHSIETKPKKKMAKLLFDFD